MKRWLLADDDSDDMEMFCELVEEIDPSITCYCASDGQEAIDKLTGGEFLGPDLIFLDINMPGMNGWECLALLKKNPLWENIPVIMYSTSSHRKEKQLASELGAIGFFTKPAGYTQLKNILTFLMSPSAENSHELNAFLGDL